MSVKQGINTTANILHTGQFQISKTSHYTFLKEAYTIHYSVIILKADRVDINDFISIDNKKMH